MKNTHRNLLLRMNFLLNLEPLVKKITDTFSSLFTMKKNSMSSNILTGLPYIFGIFSLKFKNLMQFKILSCGFSDGVGDHFRPPSPCKIYSSPISL